MNIEIVLTYSSAEKKKMSELVCEGEITHAESLVYEKVMGLSTVLRAGHQNPYKNLCGLLENFFARCDLDRSKIKYIFLLHTSDYILPGSMNLSDKLATLFQLDSSLIFGSTLNKCATPFYFFQLSKQLFLSMSSDEFILVLNSDVAFTRILKTIPGSTVMGDMASLVLLGKNGLSHRYVDIELQIDTRFCQGVFADSQEVLLFQSEYAQQVCAGIKLLLKRNNLMISDLALILPHNVNTLSWKEIARLLEISDKKIFLENIPKYGHCFGSDSFLNLQDVIVQKLIKPGDYYLMVSVGLGATYSFMLFQY